MLFACSGFGTLIPCSVTRRGYVVINGATLARLCVTGCSWGRPTQTSRRAMNVVQSTRAILDPPIIVVA